MASCFGLFLPFLPSLAYFPLFYSWVEKFTWQITRNFQDGKEKLIPNICIETMLIDTDPR
jgi:hypothetical protein